MKLPFYLLLFSILIIGCQPTNSPQKLIDTLTFSWELQSNHIAEKPRFRAVFTIKNNGTETLKNDWILYFNQTNRHIKLSNGAAKVEQINGDWYRMIPRSDFVLAAGDSIDIAYEGGAWLIKESDAPTGLYMTFLGKEGEEESIASVQNYTILPFEREEQIMRHHVDQESMPTKERFFEENAPLSLLAPDSLLPFIPSPIDYQVFNQYIQLDNSYKIAYYGKLKQEALYLQNALMAYGLDLTIVKADTTRTKIILLEAGQSLTYEGVEMSKDASYYLRISDAYPRKAIEGEVLKDGYMGIMAGTGGGIFNGIQSILQIVANHYQPDERGKIIIPKMLVWDAPRFPYRGLHLDIARNFQNKQAIKKLLDIMAFYKLNKLHLHLTEDEGWRIAIAGLPELTEYGAKRGHTLTEATHLQPAYGSGPNANSHPGSGYLSRTDFKEILQYAAARYIEVIPEINVPGHARAAIKSMEYRYRNLMEKGDTAAAKEFLLHDLKDSSEYLSIQSYPDNVVCPCQESTYHFYETVVADLVKQYKEAGLVLKTLHTGGDEVPKGVWEKSPTCQQWMKQNKQIVSAYDLTYYFRERVATILEKYDLTMAGWEEIALRRTASGRYNPNPDFQTRAFLPYVWNNLWGNQDLGNRLANAGYPVVLANVTHLYFDLAYNNDPKEPGFYWGGFVNTKKAWEFMPFDVLNATCEDAFGKPMYVEKNYAAMDFLTDAGKQNIRGIQGQLWSETIRSADMLEYYYLPKLMGLAERAWAQQPDWAINLDEKAMNTAWNVFANTLGQRDLPRLEHLFGGYHYRKPTVGEKDGKANVAFPGYEEF